MVYSLGHLIFYQWDQQLQSHYPIWMDLLNVEAKLYGLIKMGLA